MILLSLLAAYVSHRQGFVLLAIVLAVIDMVWPTFFYYPSRVWFGLAHLMGNVMSRVMLSILFFVLVTPVGVLRRMGGADPMRIKQWKAAKSSAFKTRDHIYTAQNLEQPY